MSGLFINYIRIAQTFPSCSQICFHNLALTTAAKILLAFSWRNSKYPWKIQSIKTQIQFIFPVLTSVILDDTLTILDNEKTEEEMFMYHILESKCTGNQIIIAVFSGFLLVSVPTEWTPGIEDCSYSCWNFTSFWKSLRKV